MTSFGLEKESAFSLGFGTSRFGGLRFRVQCSGRKARKKAAAGSSFTAQP